MTETHALYVAGDATLLDSPTTGRVAIVGARAASLYGETTARDLATTLALTHGKIIVSGGAYGIDAAAHQAALDAGMPTIAVLAGGVDRAYPAGHRDLFAQIIAQGGALVSEYPDGSTPTRGRFLERTRVIAELSAVTIVVEAGYRSGSLHVAHAAREMGCPVGAVPGQVSSTSSAGCHYLIRDEGAALVTSADDVLALIPRA